VSVCDLLICLHHASLLQLCCSCWVFVCVNCFSSHVTYSHHASLLQLDARERLTVALAAAAPEGRTLQQLAAEASNSNSAASSSYSASASASAASSSPAAPSPSGIVARPSCIVSVRLAREWVEQQQAEGAAYERGGRYFPL